MSERCVAFMLWFELEKKVEALTEEVMWLNEKLLKLTEEKKEKDNPFLTKEGLYNYKQASGKKKESE